MALVARGNATKSVETLLFKLGVMKNEYYIVIVIRLLVFCLLQTSYVPDEYFQFTEPALKFAYSVETM